MTELEGFRAEKDAFFRDDPHSPLLPEQRASFDGLSYFPENQALRIRASLETDGVDRDERIVMQTTTGDEQEYRRAGVVRFEVDGEATSVSLFGSSDVEGLFLPFRDATSGRETYGAGRYLDVEPPGGDGIVSLDLNLAYNPNCAYNPAWSCPIPPRENWLAVPIRAGERTSRGRRLLELDPPRAGEGHTQLVAGSDHHQQHVVAVAAAEHHPGGSGICVVGAELLDRAAAAAGHTRHGHLLGEDLAQLARERVPVDPQRDVVHLIPPSVRSVRS